MFNIITTAFLVLSCDVSVIISSIRTLNHLCSLSCARASVASRLAFAITQFVRSQLLQDSVFITLNHPFDEPLWSTVLDLLLTVQTTQAGKAALQDPKIQVEIRSCLSLLKDTPSVVDKATSLLDSLTQPVSKAVPKAMSKKVSKAVPKKVYKAMPKVVPEVVPKVVPEAVPEAVPLQPISPLHPRTATISRIELNQRPLLQQLSERAPPGTDFLSLLLFLLADDSTHAFAYRAVECLDDLLDEGGAARRA